MAPVDVDDRGADADDIETWEIRQRRMWSDPEGEHIQTALSGREGVRLPAGEMHEAVAGADLERRILVALTLPREPGARKNEEDLLVALGMERSRAAAGRDADPVHVDPVAAGGTRQLRPGAADRSGLVVLALDVVPVND